MKTIFKGCTFVLLFLLLFGVIIFAVPDQFGGSYQRAIVRQYDYYRSIKEKKIVFVGESGLSFGFDLDLMESLTKRPCAVIGNHYGDGMLFQLQIVKSNLHPGDTVVIVYNNYAMPSGEAELLLSGLGKRIDMYRFFPVELWGKVLNGFPYYFQKNLKYWREWGYFPLEPYALSSYDERGNMVLQRDECLLPEVFTDAVFEEFGGADFYALKRDIDYSFIDYLNRFIEYCKKREVNVFFTVPIYYDASVPDYCDEESMEEYDAILQKSLDAEFISETKNYIFPRKYIYDTVGHCNSEGARIRTELLYHDLLPYLE